MLFITRHLAPTPSNISMRWRARALAEAGQSSTVFRLACYYMVMDDHIVDQGRPRRWTLSAAKSHLSEVVQTALDGEPQRIVRGGRDVVVVVAQEAFESSRAPKQSVVELFSALRGTELQIDRDRDNGREVDL